MPEGVFFCPCHFFYFEDIDNLSNIALFFLIDTILEKSESSLVQSSEDYVTIIKLMIQYGSLMSQTLRTKKRIKAE